VLILGNQRREMGGGVQSAEEGKDFWPCLISTTVVAGIDCYWS